MRLQQHSHGLRAPRHPASASTYKSASSRKHRTKAVRTSENHPGKRQLYSARLDGDWKNFSRLVRLALEKPFERLRRFGAG